jgi:hypothetical protein
MTNATLVNQTKGGGPVVAVIRVSYRHTIHKNMGD